MKLYTLDNQFIEEALCQPYSFTGIVVNESNSKYYLLNGYFHRIDGPAVEHISGTKFWYINGEQIKCTNESFKLLIDIMRLKGLM